MGYTFTVTTVTPVVTVNSTDTTVSVTQNLSTVTVNTNAVFLNRGPSGYTGSAGSNGYVGSTGELPKWTYVTTSSSAVSNMQYLIDSSVYDISVTLPASPTDGDYVNFVDAANWNTHPLTILRNGKTIQGQTSDVIIDVQGIEVSLVYNSTIDGWRITTSIGAKGYNGSTGFTGSIGFTGSVGAQGTVGFTGSIGFVGSRGFTGSAGTNGTNGSTGFTGSTGAQGTTGFTGSAGVASAATTSTAGSVLGATGICNVLLGQNAGNSTINASGNTTTNIGIGPLALASVTTATLNVAVGYSSLNKISTGIGNIGFGVGSLGLMTDGRVNTAIGYNSLGSYLSGDFNTAVGYNSLNLFTNGCRNVAVGGNSLCGTITGQCNTAIGASAGSSNTLGSNNTFIGNDAQGLSNTSSNTITLGDSNITTIRAQVTSISALSDCRDKTNITGIPIGLDFIKELNPVKFTWNMRNGAKVGIEEIGFIAQELDSLQQKYGVESSLGLILKENPDRLEATPGKLLPIIVKAIQELAAQVDLLASKG